MLEPSTFSGNPQGKQPSSRGVPDWVLLAASAKPMNAADIARLHEGRQADRADVVKGSAAFVLFGRVSAAEGDLFIVRRAA